MKKILSFYTWYILAIFIFFASCKTGKKTTANEPNLSEVADIVNKLESSNFRPKWFKAKAQLQAKMNGQGMSFSSTIISKDKEVLWLNGKKFGIEGARFLITQDSIFAINRLQRQYLSEKTEWVAEEFALPLILAEAIDLEHMQDIFIGNPILDIIPYTDITPRENEVLLSGNRDDYKSELMVNSNTMHTRYFNLSQGENILTVKYSDYRVIEGDRAIAHRRDINIQRPGEEDIQLSILYDNISINEEQNIKFNIPSNYSRM